MKNNNLSGSCCENNVLSVLSLDPLLDFWEKNLVPQCSHMAAMYEEIKEKLDNNPELLMEKITPVLSTALKRGQDELHKNVHAIIKEKCTAVHPSVEWRFEKAAMDHMERVRSGNTESEMEPIIFKDVVPFYGQADIRGSSQARNKGIQQDLTRQMNLALNIVQAAVKHRTWPLLQEFQYRIKNSLEKISSIWKQWQKPRLLR